MPPDFKLCYITDRKSLQGVSLTRFVVEAVGAGVNLVQIREKDLETRALLELVESALAASPGCASHVVVNDRVDVAFATGVAGVHLGVHSIPVEVVRRFVPSGFLVGVSCHSVADVRRAEDSGANYALLGPIFETPSKVAFGPPLGLEELRRATSGAKIPVLALGGISVDKVKSCREAGAAGIAGIRIFQEAPSLRLRVEELCRV